MEDVWRIAIKMNNALISRAYEICDILRYGSETSDTHFVFEENTITATWNSSDYWGDDKPKSATFPTEYLALSNEEIHAKRT